MSGEHRDEHHALPEQRLENDRELEVYMVHMRPDERPTEGLKRAELRDRGMERARLLIERMHGLVAERGLKRELETPKELPALPVFGIRATRRVVEMIRMLPEVKSVFRDAEDVRAL